MNWKDHIDDYLDGHLDASQTEAFEAAMASDSQLRVAVSLNQDARKLLRVAGHQAQRDRIKALDSAGSGSPSRIWRSAAAIALLISLPLLWFVLRPSNPSLISEYFEPYPDRISTMGTHENTSLVDAMQHYNEGAYRDALDAFKSVKSDETQEDLVALYIAVSHLALGECEAASTVLEELVKEEDAITEAANWYHILMLVDCHRESEAKSALRSYLGNPQNRFNRSKAELLLKELE